MHWRASANGLSPIVWTTRPTLGMQAGSRFFVVANNFKRKHPEQNTTTYFRKIYLAEIRLTKSTVIFLLTLICGKINDIINI